MLCIKCRMSLPEGSVHKRCDKCRIRANQIVRNYRRNNPEKLRIAERLRHQKRKATVNIARSLRSALVRIDILKHYGGLKCGSCPEARLGALTIDHIHGGGKQHRRECGQGTKFYGWLKNNAYPPGYRVLCSNCNVLAWLKQRKFSQTKAAITCR